MTNAPIDRGMGSLQWKLRWMIAGKLMAYAVRIMPQCNTRAALMKSMNDWGKLWRHPDHIPG